jgi:ubiquinone/menaquinone biosynthesis C-methylase UbiE
LSENGLSEVKENKGFVSAEYLKRIARDAKQIKARSYELLQLEADSQVLDVGCGPATDTVSLAEYIGDKGRIIGIDTDPNMIEKANLEVKQCNITKNIQHMEGNAQALPFADGEFDRVHAERLLQVLPKSVSAKVFAEMNRVLRSNGRIVLVDTDWGSASVNFNDNELERRLITFFATKMRPNGFAGRELLGLLKESHYKKVTVEVVPFLTWDFSETPFFEWVPTEALKNNVATKKELERWSQELTQKTAQGTFLSCVNMLIVAGNKTGTDELRKLMDVKPEELVADLRVSRQEKKTTN